jgi:hypothetical protein
MNPYAYYLILPTLSFCIGIWCFFLAIRRLKARKHIYKRGTKEAGSENSVTLIWAQIIGIFILGIVMLIYTLVYAIIVLPLFYLDK